MWKFKENIINTMFSFIRWRRKHMIFKLLNSEVEGLVVKFKAPAQIEVKARETIYKMR